MGHNGQVTVNVPLGQVFDRKREPIMSMIGGLVAQYKLSWLGEETVHGRLEFNPIQFGRTMVSFVFVQVTPNIARNAQCVR